MCGWKRMSPCSWSSRTSTDGGLKLRWNTRSSWTNWSRMSSHATSRSARGQYTTPPPPRTLTSFSPPECMTFHPVSTLILHLNATKEDWHVCLSLLSRALLISHEGFNQCAICTMLTGLLASDIWHNSSIWDLDGLQFVSWVPLCLSLARTFRSIGNQSPTCRPRMPEHIDGSYLSAAVPGTSATALYSFEQSLSTSLDGILWKDWSVPCCQ